MSDLMKRIAELALVAATLLTPLAASQFASAQQYGGDNGQWSRDRDTNDGDRNNHRRHDRGDNRDGRDHNGNWNNGDRNGGWDRSRNNGYTWNGRWNYGPPPSAYYGQQGYSPGYRAWRRGDRLPDYYRNGYEGVDYRAYHLRHPPRGYHYVRDDRGDILLVGIATGVILSAILGGNY